MKGKKAMLDEEKKTSRLEARVPASVHALLVQAASLQGRTMTDFVVSAAREAAENAISRHSAIELTLDEQERFAEALLNPPPLSSALKRAISDNQSLFEHS